MGFDSGPKPEKLFGANINDSEQGLPYPVVIGCGQTSQTILSVTGFDAKAVSEGGKGGGKGSGDVYNAVVVASPCAGAIVGIVNVWSGNTWLQNPQSTESYTVASGFTYTPTNATQLSLDLGVSFALPFSGTYNDLGAPTSTTLSGTYQASLTLTPWYESSVFYTVGFKVFNGTNVYTSIVPSIGQPLSNASVWTNSGAGLTTGTYSVNPSTGTYYFSSSDIAKSATLSYSYNYAYIEETETDLVPSTKTIQVGGNNAFYRDGGVIYPLTGVEFSKVSGTPSVAGTYSVSGSAPATYKFATGDIGAEVQITYSINDPNAVQQGQSQLLNYEVQTGGAGQTPFPLLSSTYPNVAFSYPYLATVLYNTMFLGSSGELQENRFEILTADATGGGNPDANPIQCVLKVLANQQWGLATGPTPFPTQCIDNGSGGTWGNPPATPGAAVSGSDAWTYCAANNIFFSPVIDSQDTAASVMGPWFDAAGLTGFMSEGYFKIVPRGDTSAAANGATWVAPSQYAVALDDTCFLEDPEGGDPVKFKRTSVHDASNYVQGRWTSRVNQYAPEITPEWDQAAINLCGIRREEIQDWPFIHTVGTAQTCANLRVKRSVYIRIREGTFRLPYIYGCILEPMDIVPISTQSVWSQGLNNANLGIVNMLVRIQKIVDNPGEEGLEVTFEEYPFGAHAPVAYNKQLNQSEPVANLYADPGETTAVIFEAPNRLANFSGETVKIGANGANSNWGGCDVMVSTDNLSYKQAGTIESGARMGVLAQPFPLMVTDSFSSGTTLSSSWTTNVGTFSIVTSGSPANGVVEIATVPADFRACAWFNSTTFNANQWVQATLTSVPTTSGDALGVAVRMASSGETFYGFYLTPTAWFFFKDIAGTITVFPGGTGTGSHSATIGDVIYMSANGTTLSASINGTVVSTVTDSALSSGQPGVQGFHTFNASNSLDSFQCGNLSADPDTVNSCVIGLLESSAAWTSGTTANADADETLVFIGSATEDELISYSTANTTGQNQLTLSSYIRRGQMGTTQVQHQAGDFCLRMDDAVFTYLVDPIYFGTTIYFKFLSFNIFGNNTQDLSAVQPVLWTVPGNNPGSFSAATGDLFPQYNSAIYQGAYSASVAYLVGNIVGYLGNTYQCIEATTAGTAPTNTTFWILISANNAVFLGNWSSATAYQISNTVIDVAGGGGLYYCLVANTNVQPSTNSTDWQSLGNPSSNVFIGTWSSSVHYAVGNIVEYLGSQYVAVSANTNITPVIGSSAWTLLGSNALFTGTWSSSTAYTANMIAVENGNMYQCILANTNQVPPNATYWQLTGPATLDNLLDGSVWIKNVGLESSQSIVVPNSNFQASASIPIPGWGASNATVSYETSSPFAGTQSLKIVATAQFGGVQSIKSWAVTPGQQFFFSCAMKSDGTQIADAGLAFYQANGTFISSVACPAYTTASWAVATTFGAAPALASSMKIFLENGTGAGGVVEFDEPNIQMILTSSNTLVGQGSIATVSDYALSYAATTTTITWSWSAFNVYCPNGTTYTIAASTGTATAHSLPTSGTIQTSVSNAPIEYTGLTASHTYNFTPFVTLNANGTGTVNILWTNATQPTLAQQAQVANGDTSVPCSGSIFVTAATPASGTGGGGGGGGSPTCFSPNTRVKTQRGDVRIDELRPKQDYVLTARGTWKRITYVTTKDWHEEMMDMGNGEYTTPGHHFLDESDAAKPWKPVKEFMQFPRVAYHGTIHNVHVDCDDDGSAADTEHSFTLANGCVVHNFLPTT